MNFLGESVFKLLKVSVLSDNDFHISTSPKTGFLYKGLQVKSMCVRWSKYEVIKIVRSGYAKKLFKNISILLCGRYSFV